METIYTVSGFHSVRDTLFSSERSFTLFITQPRGIPHFSVPRHSPVQLKPLPYTILKLDYIESFHPNDNPLSSESPQSPKAQTLSDPTRERPQPLALDRSKPMYCHRRPQRPLAPALRVRFVSYAHTLGKPRLPFHTILTIDCTTLPCPSFCLQKRYTGLDRQISDAVFARSRSEATYQWALDRIFDQIRYWTPNCGYDEVMVLVKCMQGMHRSVAMAERLADEVRRWRGVLVRCEHLDLGEAVGAMVQRGYGPYRRIWRGN